MKPNLKKIIDCFYKKNISDKDLNKLFYFSLFDGSVFEDETDFFPVEKVVDYRKKTLTLLKKIFNKRDYIYSYLNNIDFQEFEKYIIATDFLSRIILVKKLKNIGVKSKIIGNFDIEIMGVLGELKRICLWTNYSNYFDKFFKKTLDKTKKYIYIVACTHPFMIEKIVPIAEDRKILNKYLHKIIRSHYWIEKLISKKNIIFIIRYIHKDGGGEYNLSSLCEEIKHKINSTQR